MYKQFSGEKKRSIGCLSIFILWISLIIIRANIDRGKFWEEFFSSFITVIYCIGIAMMFIIAIINNNLKKDKITKEKEHIKLTEEKNLQLQEIERIQKIENMEEQEFISFVKHNHNNLKKHFKDNFISNLAHGEESISYRTAKYTIVSTIETNDFNEFIEIYRKSDNMKIFSACWGWDID